MITVDEFAEKYSRFPTERDPDWRRESTMGETVVVDVPLLAPGKCLSCGSGTKDGRKYVDLGVDLDTTPNFNHSLYLCEKCIEGLAELVGVLARPVAENSVTRKLIDLAGSVNDLVDTVEELKGILDGDSASNYVDPSSVVDSSTSVPVGETEPDSKSSSGPKLATSKSPTSRRPSDIPSLNDILGRSGNS